MQVAGRTIALDKEGYLKHLEDWDQQVANALADTEGLALSDSHWELIHAIRGFYEEFGLSPAMRPLVGYVKRTLGPEKGNSMYLLKHFPDSPAKRLSKIAGLPRPENCL